MTERKSSIGARFAWTSYFFIMLAPMTAAKLLGYDWEFEAYFGVFWSVVGLFYVGWAEGEIDTWLYRRRQQQS